MNEIFKVINYFQKIYLKSELKAFFDSTETKIIISNEDKEAGAFENLSKQVELVKGNFNDSFNNGFLCKVSDSNWLYIEQSKNNFFKGYAFIDTNKYSFSFDALNFVIKYEKVIPLIDKKKIQSFLNLAVKDTSPSEISKKINIDVEKIINTIKFYKDEINAGKKYLRKNLDLIVQQTSSVKIRKNLNIYIDKIVDEIFYTDEINNKFKTQFIKLALKKSHYRDINRVLNISKKEIDYFYNLYDKEIYESNLDNIKIEEKEYYPNGNIKWICPIRNGLIDGKVKVYNSDGSLHKEIYYVKGFEFRGGKIVDDNGKVNIVVKHWSKRIKDKPDFNPAEPRTKELLLYSLRKNWKTLEFVPDKSKTEEMCLIAFNQNWEAIEFFPNEFITEEICKRAFKESPNAIKYIPEKFRTEEMCLIAFNQNWEAIEFFPNKFKTKEICIKAMEQSWNAIKYIPKKFRTEEMCIVAPQGNKDAIKYTPDTLKNKTSVPCVENKNINISNAEIEQKPNYIEVIKINNQTTTKDSILNKKQESLNDLIRIETPEDKIFNLSLIRKEFLSKYPELSDNISNVTKTSNYLRLLSGKSGIYFDWIFRKDALEIALEFDIKNVGLYKYFLSIESVLKKEFEGDVIIGQSKSKTFVYLSKVKYSLNWATESMKMFYDALKPRLDNYFEPQDNLSINEKEPEIALNEIKINNVADSYENLDISKNIKEYDTEEIEENYFEENYELATEGQKISVQLTRYERNPKNRAIALQIHGTTCLACGFNFNDFYGSDLAKNFIEVHHINPVSEGEFEVNPKTDLIPLCSNCHSIIHKETIRPSSIEEIKNRYKKMLV